MTTWHHSVDRRYIRCYVEESEILPPNGQTRHCPKITACPVDLVHALEMPFTDSTRVYPLNSKRTQVRRRLNRIIVQTESPWPNLRYEKFEIPKTSSMIDINCR